MQSKEHDNDDSGDDARSYNSTSKELFSLRAFSEIAGPLISQKIIRQLEVQLDYRKTIAVLDSHCLGGDAVQVFRIYCSVGHHGALS